MFTQQNRSVRLDTPLGEDALLLANFEASEDLSIPFRFHAHAYAQDRDLPVASLLRRPVLVSLQLADSESRYFHGYVSRVRETHPVNSFKAYDLEIRPWLWFLSLTHDCRIFQNLTAPEIISQIFEKYGTVAYQFRLVGTCPKREYCVQYCESDLAFVSRLLEDEGIHYYFEHTSRAHTLVLTDQSTAAMPLPYQPEVEFRPLANAGAADDNQVIQDLERQHEVFSGQFSLRDYDFEQPNNSLYAAAQTHPSGEHYFYPGRFRNKQDGDRYATIRLQEVECRSHTVQGIGTCRSFQPGYSITIGSNYSDDYNGQYLLTRVEHMIVNTPYESRGSAREHESYTNHFQLIPRTTVFRPLRRTPKPIIRGSQTAVVTGRPGSELHDDQYGRIKVHFHWDRHSLYDDRSSCWIRVAQYWAGKNWGSLSIPRVGQEVIVDYLEGDPDQPVIAGRLYNAEQRPPYNLPHGDVHMGFRSKTLYGKGYNEISINDTAGHEQVTIHSQHDMQTRIEHNKHTSVQDAYTVDCDTLRIDAATSITLHTGASQIYMDKHGHISITGTVIDVAAAVNTNVSAPVTNVTGSSLMTVTGGVTDVHGSLVKVNC